VAPLRLREHASFETACAEGACAYRSARQVRRWMAWPRRLIFSRFGQLRTLVAESPGVS
jgi:hypothetical protein